MEIIMGTNYYLRNKPCPTCGHVRDDVHIGKSSVGWQFVFRGYQEDGICSYKDWLEELKDENKQIVDECGRVKTIEEFRECVERPERKEMLNHCNIAHRIPHNEKETKYLREHPFPYTNPGRYWKDNEGYSFYQGEFI